MNIEIFILSGLLCCLALFFAGVVDSITGGGGLITIPAMLAVGIPVHYITGTSQCSAWLGTGVAAYKYVRSGNIHLKSALITLPFAVLGSYIGARLNLMVPDRYLKVFMLVTVPVIAIFIFANKKLGEEDHVEEKTPLSIALWSAVIGLQGGGYSQADGLVRAALIRYQQIGGQRVEPTVHTFYGSIVRFQVDRYKRARDGPPPAENKQHPQKHGDRELARHCQLS